MTFKIGDQVQLKSGGPIMTVTNTGAGAGGKAWATCTWFDKQEKENSGTYPPEALNPYREEKAAEPTED